MEKRAVGDWIVKCKHLFQMRSGRRKLARKHQTRARGVVTENEPAGIVPLTAPAQQILGQALRQIEFASEHVIARLPVRNLKELRGRTQLLPQLASAGIGLAHLRSRIAFDGEQYGAQGSAKFKFLLLAFRGVG
jgi:hypothetical protein